MPNNAVQGLKNAQGKPFLGGAQTIQAAPPGDIDPDMLMKGEIAVPTEGLATAAEGIGSAGRGIFNKGFIEAIRGLQEGFKPTFEHLGRQLRGAAPAEGYSWSVRAPKAGGVLDEVLSRAGLKSATGEAMTPGESRLLEHFSKIAKADAGR